MMALNKTKLFDLCEISLLGSTLLSTAMQHMPKAEQNQAYES